MTKTCRNSRKVSQWLTRTFSFYTNIQKIISLSVPPVKTPQNEEKTGESFSKLSRSIVQLYRTVLWQRSTPVPTPLEEQENETSHVERTEK